MGYSYRVRDPDKLYFCTFGIVGRIKIFDDEVNCEIVMDSLRFCQQKKGLELFGYCLMPNHLHFIARGTQETSLPTIIRDFKRFTNRDVIGNLGNSKLSRDRILLAHFSDSGKAHCKSIKYKVWQDGYHGKELYYNAMMDQKLEYIHNNPVAAGLVALPERYYYSSANYYLKRKGPLEVLIIS